MNVHRRTAALAGVILVGAASITAAQAAGAARSEQPATVDRVHRFYAHGPTADYDGDAGGLSAPDPLVWSVPGDGTRTAVVEASFQYRTEGPGPFVFSVGVREVDGPRAKVRPEQFALAPAVEGASTTVRFLVPALPAGHTYQAETGVNASFTSVGRNWIKSRKVLLTVESTS